jgi:hypothetical protein
VIQEKSRRVEDEYNSQRPLVPISPTLLAKPGQFRMSLLKTKRPVESMPVTSSDLRSSGIRKTTRER